MNDYLEEAIEGFLKALDRLISEGLDASVPRDLADYFAYMAFCKNKDGRWVSARLAERLQPGVTTAPDPEPIPEAQEPQFTEAELNRLAFYRQLVNAGKLSEGV